MRRPPKTAEVPGHTTHGNIPFYCLHSSYHCLKYPICVLYLLRDSSYMAWSPLGCGFACLVQTAGSPGLAENWANY